MNKGLKDISYLIKCNNVVRTVGVAASVCLMTMIATVIAPIHIKSAPVEAESGTAKQSTLTYSATNTTASVKLNVTSKDGTFATSDENEKIKFSLSTNNATGYTLRLKFDANASLSTTSGNTLLPITTNVTTSNFTMNNLAGQDLNNKWGYIPSYFNSIANTNTYYPTTTDNVTLRKTSTANSSNGIDNADNYSIGLGLRADYTNLVVLILAIIH